MATIRFKGFGDINLRVGGTILEAATELGAPEGSECGGCCSCSTCHVYVTQGAECLSAKDDDELDILELAADVKPESRLGCQAAVVKDGIIEVEISEESREAYFAEHPSARKKLGL